MGGKHKKQLKAKSQRVGISLEQTAFRNMRKLLAPPEKARPAHNSSKRDQDAKPVEDPRPKGKYVLVDGRYVHMTAHDEQTNVLTGVTATGETVRYPYRQCTNEITEEEFEKSRPTYREDRPEGEGSTSPKPKPTPAAGVAAGGASVGGGIGLPTEHEEDEGAEDDDFDCGEVFDDFAKRNGWNEQPGAGDGGLLGN